MADRLFLSLWLRNFNEDSMLLYWRQVMEIFASSASATGVRSITVYPLDWGESPAFERSFGDDVSPEEMVNLVSEFLHDDYAYEAEMTWRVWVPDSDASPESDGWSRLPVTVSIACLGREFEKEDTEDRSDIRISFGLDSPFLPPEEDELADIDSDVADLRTRENIEQLVDFVHRLDETLPIIKRRLWCESGESLAEKILGSVDGGH